MKPSDHPTTDIYVQSMILNWNANLMMVKQDNTFFLSFFMEPSGNHYILVESFINL